MISHPVLLQLFWGEIWWVLAYLGLPVTSWWYNIQCEKNSYSEATFLQPTLGSDVPKTVEMEARGVKGTCLSGAWGPSWEPSATPRPSRRDWACAACRRPRSKWNIHTPIIWGLWSFSDVSAFGEASQPHAVWARMHSAQTNPPSYHFTEGTTSDTQQVRRLVARLLSHAGGEAGEGRRTPPALPWQAKHFIWKGSLKDISAVCETLEA